MQKLKIFVPMVNVTAFAKNIFDPLISNFDPNMIFWSQIDEFWFKKADVEPKITILINLD